MAVYPRKILLATDLSARSDRAQDRAVSLVRQCGSELVVLHVLGKFREINSIRRIPFFPFRVIDERKIEITRRQILEELSVLGPRVSVRIEEGVPRETIMRIAREEGCELVVTGVARSEVFGSSRIGSTVDYLLRHSEIPMLVVTERARAPYRKIVVIADLTEMSKRAIETAAGWFPDALLSALQPHSAPRASAVDDIDGYREQMRQVAHRDLVKFYDTIDLTADQRARINLTTEFGTVTALLKDMARLSDIELVVLGSRKRGFLADALFDSEEMRIISSLPCDVLIVR